MTEQRDLSRLSPQGLNIMFGQFLKLIPINGGITGNKPEQDLTKFLSSPNITDMTPINQFMENMIESIVDTLERRGKSNLLSVCQQELTSLLQLSCLTASATQNVIKLYSDEFVSGVFGTNPHDAVSHLYWLCEPTEPNSGGVFHPNSAAKLEYKLLLQETDKYHSFEFIQRSRENSPRLLNGEVCWDKETLLRGRNNVDAMEKRILKWKNEYSKKHH
ncbi:MAG: hypothetical protein WCV81_05770 [Microgenomates group bacterium]|jgi:hypothetical protein